MNPNSPNFPNPNLASMIDKIARKYAYTPPTPPTPTPENHSCRIRATSNQTLTAGVLTKLNMHTTDFNRDTGIFEVDLPNNRIKVLKAGVYQIIGMYSVCNANNGQRIDGDIYKNGNNIKGSLIYPGGAGTITFEGVTLTECSANDYIELYMFTTTTKTTYTSGVNWFLSPNLQIILLELD